nr:hypothetical protein BdHM001_02140 [Bdellovibrio sp. HM001]
MGFGITGVEDEFAGDAEDGLTVMDSTFVDSVSSEDCSWAFTPMPQAKTKSKKTDFNIAPQK